MDTKNDNDCRDITTPMPTFDGNQMSVRKRFHAMLDEDFPGLPSTLTGKTSWYLDPMKKALAIVYGKIAIIIFDNSRAVKQFRVPKSLFVFAGAVLVSCAAYVSWIIPDYQRVKAKIPLLTQYQNRNQQQELRLAGMAERVQKMTKKINEFQAIDRKIKVMTNFEMNGTDDNALFQAVGGSEPTPLSSDYVTGSREREKEKKKPKTPPESIVTAAEGIVSSTRLDNRLNKTIRPAGEGGFSSEEEGLYPYSLQLGSYRTIEQARKAVSNHRAKGLSPYWAKADLGEKGIWFRVFAGHFKHKEEAEKFREKNGLRGSVLLKTEYANLIGHYAVEDEFLDEISALQNLDYLPYVIKDDSTGFRLYIGAFLTRAAAEQQHQELQSDGFHNQILKR